MFYGEKGSLLITGGDGYKVFDFNGKEIKNVTSKGKIDPLDKASPASQLDALHVQNLFSAITKGTKLASDIDSGHKSTLLVQLGNIACRTGRSLNIDPANGHILKDKEAGRLWSRKYEKGWEMKL